MIFRPAGFENFFRDSGHSSGVLVTEEKIDENKQ